MARGMGIVCWLAAAILLCSSQVEAQGWGNTCLIGTTSVDFGTYDVFGSSPVDSTGRVIFWCGSAVQNVTVTLSRGQSGTYTPRTLTQGGETLAYNLFLDAACTSVWGDGTGGTQVYFTANPPSSVVVLTVYGRIPASQDVSAGDYADTVIATINW